VFCFNIITHLRSLEEVFIWLGAKLRSFLRWPLHTVVPFTTGELSPFTTGELSLVITVVKQDCPSCCTKGGEIWKLYFFQTGRKNTGFLDILSLSLFPSPSVLFTSLLDSNVL